LAVAGGVQALAELGVGCLAGQLTREGLQAAFWETARFSLLVELGGIFGAGGTFGDSGIFALGRVWGGVVGVVFRVRVIVSVYLLMPRSLRCKIDSGFLTKTPRSDSRLQAG